LHEELLKRIKVCLLAAKSTAGQWLHVLATADAASVAEKLERFCGAQGLCGKRKMAFPVAK
jgi:hypothetical protein